MLDTRSPWSRTSSSDASQPIGSSFGEINPTWSMPRSAQSARSSANDCCIEQMLFTERRGCQATSVLLAAGQLRREQVIHGAVLHRDHPVVVRDAPAVGSPDEAR